MPLVASVDYPNKRIYLSVDTVGITLDTMDLYHEVRALRRVTEAHRNFRPMIVAGGNVEKITGQTYTQPYVQLLYGCRIVPYDAAQKLKVIRDTFTDDGAAGRDCFSRVGLVSLIDIDVDVQAVEVRIVNSSGGATLAEIEASTILAKEATAQKAARNASLAAALSA